MGTLAQTSHSHNMSLSKIAIASSLALFANAVPAVTSTCTWVGGTYGQPITCPEGYMVTGTCGSGQTADCNDYHTEMYCCDMSQSSNCGWSAGQDGDLVGCSNGQSIRGICGSGARADCKVTAEKTYFGTLCCDTSDYALNTQTLTYMQYSGYGERITCYDGDVAVAGCGSGAYAQCTGVNTEHGFTEEEVAEIQAQVR